jgi:hypothetical protein
MPPPECNSIISSANQLIASRRNPRRGYEPIQGVVITSVVGTKVKLFVRGMMNETPETEWGDEAVMWAYCPSTIPSGAVDPGNGPTPKSSAPPPVVDASGTLYLTPRFCSDHGIPLPPGSDFLTPKWPDRLADAPLSEEIHAELTGLIFHGVLLDELREVTIDLRDRLLVPEQTITIGDGTVKVFLTEQGFGSLGIPVTPSGSAVFAPTSIELTGIQLENDLRFEGTVDLMDLSKAPRQQTIDLHRDAPWTAVRLTQLGFFDFDVVFSAR